MVDRDTLLTNNSSLKLGNREGIIMPSPLSFCVSCIEGRPRVCLVSIPCPHAKDTRNLLVGPKSLCGGVETDPHLLWRHEALTVSFQRSGGLMSSEAEVKWPGSHAFQNVGSIQIDCCAGARESFNFGLHSPVFRTRGICRFPHGQQQEQSPAAEKHRSLAHRGSYPNTTALFGRSC
jgi:hypothetical protein